MFQWFRRASSRIRRAALLLIVLAVASCGGSPEQRAQNFYEQGAKFLSQKDYVKAAIEFKNALQLQGSHVASWRGLAQIEEHNRNWRSLVPILRKIAELDPKDVETRLKLARLLLLANSLDDALKTVDEVLALEGRNAGAFALRSAVLLRRNDNSGAVRDAQKALEIDPKSSEALIVLAAEKVARGDPKAALEILQRAPAADQPNLGIELFKIQLFDRIGDRKQVESLLRKLSDFYPKEEIFRRQLVALYVADKRLDDAEKELRAIAAAKPADIQAGLNIVRFLSVYRGADAAKQELTARINAGGQVFPYRIAMAEFQFARGEVDDSIRSLRTLIGDAGSPENALIAQGKLAELYLKIKKLNEAEGLVSEILRKDSRNIGALKLRALIHLERGRLDPAVADLREALNDQPRATDLMLLLAVAYERGGSIDLADKQYSEALRTSGFNAGIGLSYVAFLQRRGAGARAEDVLAELANRWPNNVQVLSALASAKLAHRDWAGAEQIAAVIRRLGNASGIADQILGESLSGRSNFEQSIEVLQGAYAKAPNTTQSMAALVRTYLRAKKTDRAIGFLQDVLKKDPSNVEALVLLGSTQLVAGDADKASTSFKTAIERQPKNAAGYRALANLRIQQKQYDDALMVIRAGLKERPQDFMLRMALANTLELKGDYEGAIKQYDALLKEEPGSLIVANNLASLLTDYRTDEASLERAGALIGSLQKSPIPHFKDTVGWVYYRRGEYKTAVSLLEEAANALPNMATIRYHLGMGYIATKQNAKAAEQLQKALNLASTDRAMQDKVRAALKQVGVN